MSNSEVRIAAPDGVVLAGTLSAPRWQRIRGAVAVVHGSGPLTRSELRGDVRSLVGMGFAVLHYDKRGTGSSGGRYQPSAAIPMTRLVDILADDAAAALAELRRRVKAQGVRTGFFGASQAGWIIPLASVRCVPRPDFHVILSGAAVSTGMEGYYSQLSGDGSGPARVADRGELERRTLAFAGDAGFDPLPLWDSLRTPTLWLLGERDQSVPTFASLPVLKGLAARGHAEHCVVVYPRAGHDLRDAETGEPVGIWETLRAWWDERERPGGSARAMHGVPCRRW